MLAVDIREVVPPCYEPDFVKCILDLCRKYEVRLLLPNHDIEIAYLARHRETFAREGTILVAPDEKMVSVCRSKASTVAFGLQHGIAVPVTYNNCDDARSAIAEGRETYPLVVKPRDGFGSIGLEIVDDEVGLLAALDLVRSKAAHSVIARDPKFDPQASVIIQRMITGDEFGIDVVNDLNGKFATCLVERKIAIVGGSTDEAIVEDNVSLVHLGQKIASLVQHPGIMDCDVIVHADVPYLLEMNPRFGGHYPFAHVAGANIPAALVAWANDEPVEESWLKARDGCHVCRDLRYEPVDG